MPAWEVGPLGPAQGSGAASADTGVATASLSRRRVLAGLGATALAGTLAGCTFGDDRAPGPIDTSPAPVVDPDAARRSAAIASAQQLADAYAATASAHPDLAAVLVPIAADHADHVAILDPAAAVPTPTPTTSLATPAPTGSAATAPPTAAGPPVPADPVAARDGLVAAEQNASAQARTDAVSAVEPALARLLASIGASRALHAVALQSAA